VEGLQPVVPVSSSAQCPEAHSCPSAQSLCTLHVRVQNRGTVAAHVPDAQSELLAHVSRYARPALGTSTGGGGLSIGAKLSTPTGTSTGGGGLSMGRDVSRASTPVSRASGCASKPASGTVDAHIPLTLQNGAEAGQSRSAPQREMHWFEMQAECSGQSELSWHCT
jgi:hypothetical protein